MKAPDKIYIDPMPNPSDGYVGIAWADAHGKMKEYIRKDKLIAWAKKELDMRRNTGDDYFYPAIVVLVDLIDEINSL